jgi:hypothetical protein
MKKYFLIVFIFLISSNISAQKNPFFNSDELKNVKAVAGGALYILRQDYYIVDTTVKPNKKSGLNGNNYFGRYYFLAVLADGKFYTDRNINKPWEQDAQFNKIIEQKKYMPVLSGFAYKQIDSTTFNSIDSLVEFNKIRNLNNDTNNLYVALNTSKNLPMLHLANNNDKLLDSTSFHWALSVKEAKEYNQKKYIDTLPSLEFDLTKGKYNLDKKAFVNPVFFYNEKTIGGFIFTTKPSLGKIEYNLSGLIVRNNLGKFEAVAIKQKDADAVKIENVKKETSTKEVQVETKKEQPTEPVKITEIKDN